MPLYDPNASFAQVDYANAKTPSEGSGYVGIDPAHPEAIVVPNGGSGLIYLPRKNAPELARWGAGYADGAVVEECYVYHECASWRVFTGDRTATQPNGKWVGEAEYGADHYVCDPGRHCPGRRSFAAFCATVYAPLDGYAAVKFDVDLDGRVFLPCPSGR